jgi:hypothetical protein
MLSDRSDGSAGGNLVLAKGTVPNLKTTFYQHYEYTTLIHTREQEQGEASVNLPMLPMLPTRADQARVVPRDLLSKNSFRCSSAREASETSIRQVSFSALVDLFKIQFLFYFVRNHLLSVDQSQI